MKRLLTACLVAAGFGMAATAAHAGSTKDMIETHGHCAGGPFQGMYLGVHGGFGNANADFDGLNTALSGDGDDSGGTIGIYSGYNMQCGHVVFGIESDFNYADFESSFSPVAGQEISSHIDSFGTLRGRLGVTVTPHVLLFATAGLAYANVEHALTDTALPFAGKDEDYKFGWTVGGGLEIAHGPWSFKAEGLYIDLGSEDVNFVFDASAGCVTNCEADVRFSDDFFVGRVGLAYKFNWSHPAPVHEPYK